MFDCPAHYKFMCVCMYFACFEICGIFSFYCAMHYMHSTILHVVRLSVRLSICYVGHTSWVVLKVIKRVISLGLRSSEPQHWQSSPRVTPQNVGGIGLGSLFSAENLQYLWNGPKLLLMTNRKLHLHFWLVPKLSTLNVHCILCFKIRTCQSPLQKFEWR